ncbi:hypothetical protein Tco_1192909 [Tanacetum coccineum]
MGQSTKMHWLVSRSSLHKGHLMVCRSIPRWSRLQRVENKFEGDNTPIAIQPPCYSASKLRKPEGQWTADERKASNLDQRLKSLIMSVLPDDQINSVINCLTAKSTWDDLILYHEGPSDVKESRVMDLKLCYNTFKFKEGESLTQTFTRYKALMNELVNDGIILSKLEINNGFINGFTKEVSKVLPSLLKTQIIVKDSGLFSICFQFFLGKKNKGLIAETYDWDDEEVSSDENEVTKVKALMALTDEERVSVGKESARNGDWTKIHEKKEHLFLPKEENDDRKHFLDYLCIVLNYVEEQRNNILSKYRNLVQELNTCKEQLLVLKQAKLDLLTMQHANIEILKENQNFKI